ncbi:condensin complex subunit 2-like isoform X2 [Adelges cooleyi]|uniref:condensin complex subunit 2-like isoform X2 n=1 Tax=Adelges cooleyi TaxID=133065 RepID=UPI0021803A57|nr:condensin complex subunit 2-like isoform X2 [Adelges cooleyi]
MVLFNANSNSDDTNGTVKSLKRVEKDKENNNTMQEEQVVLTEDDDYYEHLTTDQLSVKIKMFRNLCLENKINASNAFDIDLIGHFAFWLGKKKHIDNEDIGSFQEMADNLEASAKIYGLRVDNFTENTSRLVEQVRAINYKKEMAKVNDGNEPIKVHKPKRTKMMLTSSEKLKRKYTEVEQMTGLNMKQNSIIEYNEVFEMGKPSNYIELLFSKMPLKKEIDNLVSTNTPNAKTNYPMPNIQEKISKRYICPDYNEFLAEKDKCNMEEIIPDLDGIENQFDPTNHLCQNIVNDSPVLDFIQDVDSFDALEPISTNDSEPDINALVDCIDDVQRDYSFFNPQLLAKWKGPKSWKAQAMVKALKSCKPHERKDILCSPTNDDDLDDPSQEFKLPKTPKRRNKVVNESIKLNWMKIDEIKEILEKNVLSKEKVLPRILQKWDALDNIGDNKHTVVDIIYKFTFLEYAEIRPDWWQQEKSKKRTDKNTTITESSFTHENELNFDNVVDQYDDVNDNPEISQNEDVAIAENCCDNDISDQSFMENKQCLKDAFKPEVRLDIGTLKKQMMDIIDKECTVLKSSSNWSSVLAFKDLLLKLNFYQREELTVPLVFVALLHLTNEHSLSLTQTMTLNVNEIGDVEIAKPIK